MRSVAEIRFTQGVFRPEYGLHAVEQSRREHGHILIS